MPQYTALQFCFMYIATAHKLQLCALIMGLCILVSLSSQLHVTTNAPNVDCAFTQVIVDLIVPMHMRATRKCSVVIEEKEWKQVE